MEAFLKTVVAMVVSAIIVTIPVLCGLSFALGWHPVIQCMLILGMLGVFGFVALCIADK